MFAFNNMDLFGCSPLSTWTCSVVRLYLHGLIWVFAFINLNLFWCLTLTTLICLCGRQYIHGLVWFFSFNCMDMFGCSHVSLLVSWVRCGVCLYEFLIFVLFLTVFGCSPLTIWICLVVSHYLHGLVCLLAFISIDLFACPSLSKWTCLMFAFIFMDLLECSPLSTWAYFDVCFYLHVLFA